MKITVDLELCQGHGVCADEAPGVFEVVERKGRYPQVRILAERPTEADVEAVRRAVAGCPTRALALRDE